MQGIGASEVGQARPLVTPPDLLTALRVPLALAFLLADDTNARLVVVLAAAASDVADGIWARRLGGSRIGVVLDPVCDKLFMVTTFAIVCASGQLPLLEFLGVLLRDIVAFVAFLTTVVLRHPTTLPARAGGKAVTVCQILVLLAFLTGSELLRPLAWATAAISLYAVADYVQAARRH
ncbi:MAG TPA: CDP-alcohol phosphatidyltransferase family protein [Gemmatimonadales bacterium]|nr:CDP-alcohol phosphatidyltransferase family protein [Gemmatimonadales bacterium]